MDLQWLGFLGTGLVILAYFPQLIHLIKERCSAGLSIRAYLIWAIAALLLLSYAISMNDAVFIALQIYQFGATVLILYFGIKYKGHFCETHGGKPEH